MNQKKVLIITGTRAEYGRLIPILNTIQSHPKMQLQLVVTGMHLLKEFGYSIQEIEKDGYPITAKFEMFEDGHDNFGMVKALGLGITRFTEVVKKLKPDFILVLGDRGEALVGAIVGAHLNIPVAHIHGGEVTGSIDDSIRHAITKFSHIHFAATKDSVERLKKLGEKPEYIYLVGSPGLDTILSTSFLTAQQIANDLGVYPDKETILLIQHPVTSEFEHTSEQMRNTLNACLRVGKKVIVIYPNADAGGLKMISEIERKKISRLIFPFKNLPFKTYLSLMKYVGLMVGNSSSGIMEAPSFGLPVVNIGSRQTGRERGENIIDVGYNEESIYKAIMSAFTDTGFRIKCSKGYNPYGDGKTGLRIVQILADLNITNELLSKKITY